MILKDQHLSIDDTNNTIQSLSSFNVMNNKLKMFTKKQKYF